GRGEHFFALVGVHHDRPYDGLRDVITANTGNECARSDGKPGASPKIFFHTHMCLFNSPTLRLLKQARGQKNPQITPSTPIPVIRIHPLTFWTLNSSLDLI